MVCRMVKKGLIGAGLVAGTMVLLFGAKSVHYAKYAARQVRQNAQSAVPFDADVAVARDQVKSLEPAINRGAEAVAKLEYSIKELKGEVVALRTKLDGEGRQIQALTASLDKGDVRRVTGVAVSTRELESAILHRLDTYKIGKAVLEAKEQTLTHREQLLKDALAKLEQMKDRRRALLTRIDEIEARHEVLEASQSFNEFNLDTSELAAAEKAVSELDKRVVVEDRTRQLQGLLSDQVPAAETVDGRDALKEVQEVFGRSTRPAPASADKDL